MLRYERDALITPLGMLRLRDSYMLPEEKSPQERFLFVARAFQSNEEHGNRIYEYASNLWLSFASPILAHGRGGLPISCFLPYLPDTRRGLVDTSTECRWLSMAGGGIGLGIGIRGADSKSTGVMPHLKTYDADSLAYKQADVRRGSIAAYLDLDHPDIQQFIAMRRPVGGDPNQKALNLHHGVNIPDRFMEIIEAQINGTSVNDEWPLVNPNTGEVVEVISARGLWITLLETRAETGEPMLHFIDRSNEALPYWLKALGFSIKQSNLCSEITLPTDENHTAVCCLSSLNLEYYDDWKNNELFIQDVMEFLDNVLEYFCNHAGPEYHRAVFSARNSRDVGLGTLGFHAFLQKRNIAFESALGLSLNSRIFSGIKAAVEKANLKLGAERGEAPYAKGTGRRFSHTMALAPNATSSIIVGNTSPSIEPYRANAYRQDTVSGSMLATNKYLEVILNELGQNTTAVWSSIISNKGSVQHLEFLNEYQKAVFKTAPEIDQRWIIEYAAGRVGEIDQAQSTNLFFPADAHITYVHQVHFEAWKKKLKTLYYYRSEKNAQIGSVGVKTERIIIKPTTDDSVCISCEG